MTTLPFTLRPYLRDFPFQKFLGFDRYIEGRGPNYKPNKLYAYDLDNIVTVDGSTGPWMARYISGKHEGTIVAYGWGDEAVESLVQRIEEDIGYTVIDAGRTISTEAVRSADTPEEVEEKLFGDAEFPQYDTRFDGYEQLQDVTTSYVEG